MLLQIALPKEKRRNATQLYHPMLLSEVQKLYPYVDWRDYINALLPANLKIENDEMINISILKYMEDLGKLLSVRKHISLLLLT